jgi:hypothetical protein
MLISKPSFVLQTWRISLIADHEGKINVQTNKLAEQGLTIKEQYAEINAR